MESLDRILVCELSDTLTEKGLKELSERGENVKNILIYDCLIRNKPDTIASEIPLFEQIIQARYDQASQNEKKSFRFKTPKKRMLMNLYEQNLSRDLLTISSKLETKVAFEQLYCLDEIYLHLNQNRKERIDFSGDLPSIINLSIGLYTSQMVALEMKNEIEKFANLTNIVDYSNIEIGQIKYLKSKSKKVEDYMKRVSSDFEIIQRVQESKELILSLNEMILKEVNSLDDKLNEYKKEVNSISEKKFLSKQEFLKIVQSKDNLSSIEEILKYFGNPKAEEISQIVKRYSFFINSYDYFSKNQNIFESIISEQKKLNRKANKIKSKRENLLFEHIRQGEVQRYLARTEENLQKMSDFYGNRYFSQRLDDEKDDLIGVLEGLKLNENWPKNICLKYDKISKNLLYSTSEQLL